MGNAEIIMNYQLESVYEEVLVEVYKNKRKRRLSYSRQENGGSWKAVIC